MMDCSQVSRSTEILALLTMKNHLAQPHSLIISAKVHERQPPALRIMWIGSFCCVRSITTLKTASFIIERIAIGWYRRSVPSRPIRPLRPLCDSLRWRQRFLTHVMTQSAFLPNEIMRRTTIWDGNVVPAGYTAAATTLIFRPVLLSQML